MDKLISCSRLLGIILLWAATAVVADSVPVQWDTVQSHANMFHPSLEPEGECVALVVSNHGEMGYAGVGGVNLDSHESGQECLAIGDVDCAGDNLTGADMSTLYDYLYFTYGTLACPHEANLIPDCIVDWRDLQELSDWLLATVEPPFVTHTCCDPIPMYWGDTTQPLGNSSVAIQEGYVVADGIGTTGNDGVRIFPNMGGKWQHRVGSMLDNIGLTNDGAKATFSFTGAGLLVMREPWTSIGVDTGLYLDHAVVAQVSNTVGQLELAVDFLDDEIAVVGIVPFVAGEASGSYTVDGRVSGLTSDLQSGELDVTGFSLALSDSTVLTIQLDRSIEFSIDGQSPPVTFWADELRFATVNVIQPTVGVGPLDITAANIEWLGVGLPSCCQDRVGDANGLGGDEPTIGDLSVMIDAKFISGHCEGILDCLSEADFNQSGGCNPTCDDITIGDMACLITYLFINPPGGLYAPDCLKCP